MRAALRVLIVACVLSAIPALTPPLAIAQDQGSTAEIKVLNAGKAPREQLRFSAPVGTTQTSTMTLNFAIEQSGVSSASLKSPPVRATIAATLQEMTPDGNLVIGVSYPSFEVLRGGGVGESQRKAVEQALAGLRGVTGRLTLTPSGTLVDSNLDIPPGLDPSVSEILGQLGDQLRSLSAPFPEPAVGVGATWQVAKDLSLNGIQARQVYEYTLKKRTGANLELDIRGTQTAKQQTVELPNVASGIQLRLTRYRTTFRGANTIDLNRLLPVGGAVRGNGNQTFRIEAGKESGTLRQHVDVRVALKTARS